MTIFNELDKARGIKMIRKEISEDITATYDGERFGLTNKRLGVPPITIILNPREALYLYEFIGEQVRGSKEKADLEFLCRNIP